MGRVRTTVIECDGPKCDKMNAGKDLPEGWLATTVRYPGDTPADKGTFCSYQCLSDWAVTDDAEPAEGSEGAKVAK